MAVIDDLNLKTKLVISNKDYDFELYTIHKGFIEEIKFDNRIFTVNTGEEKKEIPETTSEVSEIPGVSLDPEKKPKKKIGKYRNWSKKDMQYIKDNYGKIPTKDIAEHLGIKKLNKLHSKAYHLGLKKYNKSLPSKTPEKLPEDPEKPIITVRKDPAKDDAEEFLEWLDKWENATFTKADVKRCTTLSRLKLERVIKEQLEKDTIKRISDCEFAKLVLNGTSKKSIL